ncbi:MAG: RNA-binding protein [Vampirovibrionales bacterium]|nr:RNA-binding protein [Vampirovibrionales bacterium]
MSDINRKLFVANVSWNVSEDDLYNLFAAHGPLELMKMPMNRYTGRHKGYAFIEMANADDAAKAVEELNGLVLDQRPIAVNYQDENRLKSQQEALFGAPPNPKLFIRNIGPTASEEHLTALFSQLGQVVSLKVPADRYTGEQRTYGFAEMATTEQAQAVIERFDGTMMEGQALQILFADPARVNQRFPGGGGYGPPGGGYDDGYGGGYGGGYGAPGPGYGGGGYGGGQRGGGYGAPGPGPGYGGGGYGGGQRGGGYGAPGPGPGYGGGGQRGGGYGAPGPGPGYGGGGQRGGGYGGGQRGGGYGGPNQYGPAPQAW